MMEGSPVNSPDKITEIAMMEESPVNSPDKVEEIFRNFRGRRAGLIKALTTDFRQAYQQCDPEKECLCLYGLPNETWEVTVPSEMVPPDYPEPVLGINFARDIIPDKHWLLRVAFHCDSWLIAVAFYDGAKRKINKTDRNRLFQMINDLPTISEVLRPYANQPNDHSDTHNSSNEIKSTRKTRQSKNHTSKPMKMTMPPKEDERGVKESQQPVNHISMPMMMTMAPKESRQPVNHISMPMMMTTAPKESRQPVNHIIMPWIMTMAPMESGQPMNFISMPMGPMESRQPVNHTSMPMQMTMAPKEHETRVEVHEVQGITLCGACGKKDGPGEFRICCDTCNKWFHGLCVAMTREDAEHIMHFKCPGCRGKQKQI